MKILRFLGFLLVAAVVPWSQATLRKHYHGHKVLQVLLKKSDDFQKIIDVGNKYNVDFWKYPRYENATFDLNVSPENMEDVVSELSKLEADIKVWIDDLQKLIDEQHDSHPSREKRSVSGFNLYQYHSYSEIENYLIGITADHACVDTIGTTVQGRNIRLIKFSTSTYNWGWQTKKAIFMDGGIHAREWIAPAVVLYMVEQLAYNNDPVIKTLLDKFDWYLLPVLNPDGYEYSRTTDRLWRKNLQRTYNTGCHYCNNPFGVDLNRNFAYQWNPAIGGSTDQCSEVYAGPRPLSEPETGALASYLSILGNRAVAYLNIHSYGQFWLYPWGYTSYLPYDWKDLEDLAKVATTAIQGTYYSQYTVGEDSRKLSAAAGGADDHAKGQSGIKYSYTVELRDQGRYGFVLPASYIQPTSEEIWAGVKAMANELIRLYSL